MVTIKKGKEPQAWVEKRNTPGFTQFESSEELKQSLLEEQGYICAYCMRRLPADDPNTDATSKVEHIKPRSKYPDLQFNYDNLVICCPGNLNSQPHCDLSKDDGSISFDLFNSQLEDSITYLSSDGTIKSSNGLWDEEINRVLNLNHPILKANRLQTLTVLINDLNIRKKKSAGWTSKAMQAELRRWQNRDRSGNRLPFAGIVIAFLKKRLNAK